FLPNLNSGSMNIEEATTDSESNDDGVQETTARQSGKNDYDTKLSENTRDCLAIFETVIKQSISNLQDSTDYFKLIINVFKPLLANTNIKHFYIVIPTLIFHYVQYILKIKEKITKIKKPNL
ncbi:WASH complex subunit 7, partial [Olea europaea subsp. europaea]